MNKLRFLHIPKTAGSSFDECLYAQYLPDYLLRRSFTLTGNIERDAQRYSELSPSKRKRIKLYVGHGPRTTGLPEIDSAPTITLLREPVARVISLCQHVGEGKSPRWQTESDPQRMDLDAFLARGSARISNLQTRILLGRQSYQLPPGDERELANQAFEVLANDLEGFGLTEQFDQSLLLFREQLGWRNTPRYRHRNTGNKGNPVPLQDRHIERIRELNRIDTRLYELAADLFGQRIKRILPALEQELASFRRQQAGSTIDFLLIDSARALAKMTKPKGRHNP
jgi:hypothetical protein